MYMYCSFKKYGTKQKNLFLINYFVGLLKVNDENRRIRIH